MVKKILLLVLTIVFKINAQVNLVPNPSFESYSICPNGSDELYLAKPWFKPNTGTPDYFNSCATILSSFNVPNTGLGYCPANSGNAIVGEVFYDKVTYNGPNIFREYIATKLNSQLISGTKYYATYYIRLADSSRYASDNVSVYFGDSIKKNSFDTINVVPQITSPSGNFLTNKVAGTKLRGSFVSNGAEKYMYIGNFKHPFTNDTIFVNGGGNKIYWSFPYYFFDDICLSSDSLYCENWITKLPEYENEIDFKFYPNPLKNILYLEGSNLSGNISLLNIIGEEISFTQENNTINFENLQAGFYFLNYKTNGKTYKYKIIKE